MSSEVCPFCGKTFKRLKSHLPHCKAAASSKTPQTKHDVTANQTTSSAKALSTATSPQSKKSKKASPALPPATPLNIANTPPPSQSLSLNSASLPPSTKKKKQKLSEQIRTAIMTPRVLKGDANSIQVSLGSLEGTRSTSEEHPMADTLSSMPTAANKTKTIPDKDLAKNKADPLFLSMDTTPKVASKAKASNNKKKKAAAQSLSTTKDTSKAKAKESKRDQFWMDSEEEVEDMSVNKTFLKSGSGSDQHQGRITLQGVKATLGRVNGNRQTNRPSIMSHIETTDELSSKIKTGTDFSLVSLPTGNQDNVDKGLVTTSKAMSDHLPKSIQASLIPKRHNVTSRVSVATSTPRTIGVNEGLKVGNNMTGIPKISPILTKLQNPSSHLFPPSAKVGTTRAKGGLTMEKSLYEARKQTTADTGIKGALTQRPLGTVRLRELPEWLACKTPNHPRDVAGMVQRGWQWYYRRYIDVKKGGVGGVGMLLAGYCVLSYIWSYPHIKRDRWRKHH